MYMYMYTYKGVYIDVYVYVLIAETMSRFHQIKKVKSLSSLLLLFLFCLPMVMIWGKTISVRILLQESATRSIVRVPRNVLLALEKKTQFIFFSKYEAILCSPNASAILDLSLVGVAFHRLFCNVSLMAAWPDWTRGPSELCLRRVCVCPVFV